MRLFSAIVLAAGAAAAQEATAPATTTDPAPTATAPEVKPAAKPFALALRLEPFVPTNPLGISMMITIAGEYTLPVASGALAVGGSVGQSFGRAAEASHTLPGVTYSTSLSRQAHPLLAEATYKMPVGPVLGFARLGLGAAHHLETVTVTYEPSKAVQETTEGGWSFAFGLAVGAAMPLGPGQATGGLRFAHGNPDFRAAGANMLGGVGLELGYSLPLF